MAVSSSGLPFLQRNCFIIALIFVRMQMYRTIDRSDHSRRLYAMHKNWWQDKGKFRRWCSILLFFPVSLCLPPLSLYSSLNYSIFIAEPINGKPVSIVCSCAQATALLQHPPLQKCFFPSVPLLITSRVTLNFLCPGRRDTSLNSHNYSSSPLTI